MLQSRMARDVRVAANGIGTTYSDGLRVALAAVVLAAILALIYAASPQCASSDVIRMGTALTLPGCQPRN